VSPSPARKNDVRNAVLGTPDDAKNDAAGIVARLGGGTEVSTVQDVPDYDQAALVALESWEDVSALLETHGVEVEFADKVLGDGFSVLSTDEKMTLIGRPMMLMEWRFNNGAQGEFVSIRAIVKTGDMSTDIKKVILNDGSTGIRDQLKKFTAMTGKRAGLVVRRGLRVSEYTYEDEKTGEKRPAKTFYIDASA
jgi:hypothetical protein